MGKSLLCCAALLLAGAFVCAGEDKSVGADKGGGLEVGKDLPGPFHPYNVTGENKGKFHSLVSRFGLGRVVLVFARGVDDNEEFRDLLSKLDKAVAKHASVRLAAFVVFVADDVPNPVLDDDARDALVKRLEKLAEGVELKHMVVALGGKDELAKYKLNGGNGLTVVLYDRKKIVGKRELKPDEIAKGKEAVLADVDAKLGAKKR
jgi:hypothetical protein